MSRVQATHDKRSIHPRVVLNQRGHAQSSPQRETSRGAYSQSQTSGEETARYGVLGV